MHRRYRELLTPILGSFVYASEEAEPEVIGADPDPDLCVLVDPLDTSELAVRGLLGYTHVMVYSRAAAQPVVAVVGDIFHHLQLYVGARDEHGTDRAFVITADSQAYEPRQHTKKPRASPWQAPDCRARPPHPAYGGVRCRVAQSGHSGDDRHTGGHR
ncbi:hypothetical protein [Couchioplanes azureus]|uniref:hypothetical protein n=1 Tax=Couchioplanes caeruleus TaxID=56438 RepID=UPI0016701834|nr:hypothetical protein [Couchioplanes caeruleus]GGQ71473.1 hypothetical protein GCM10010166_47010 [Couchioplanes caeruleus subsp. azureus]